MEIERKFLVVSEQYKEDAHDKYQMIQGFLSTDPERTVRVRVLNGKGFLTVKGKSNRSGTTRKEWEFDIDEAKARDLIQLCPPPLIEKTRYLAASGDHVFEIDEFEGANRGLVVAEIELESEDESFKKPSWLGKEVTGDIKYYNAQLSITPYSQWEK